MASTKRINRQSRYGSLATALLLGGLAGCASGGGPVPEAAFLAQPLPAPNPVSAEMRERILALAARPQPAEYTIGAGDLLEVSVLDVPELQRVAVRVPIQGVVSFPLIGQVKAIGLTGMQLEQDLRARLDRYLQDPQASVFIREHQNWKVSVIGAVTKPGIYEVDRPRTILDMLALAGGITEDAEPVVSLTRLDGPSPRLVDGAAVAEGTPGGGSGLGGAPPGATATIRLDDLLANPNGEANLAVQPGDVINVPTVKARYFFVGGAVRGRGRYPLRPNLTVDQAIIMAGGLNEVASLSDVKIYRETGGPERTILPVDLHVIQAGQTGPQIQSNDVIVVERSAFLTFVYTLFGLVRGGVGLGAGSVGLGGALPVQ